MSDSRLEGKRVLLTQAEDYMGPATIEVFREHGAEVIADTYRRRGIEVTIRPATDGGES